MSKSEFDAMHGLLNAALLAHDELIFGGNWKTARQKIEQAAAKARPFISREWAKHYPDSPMWFGFPWERTMPDQS